MIRINFCIIQKIVISCKSLIGQSFCFVVKAGYSISMELLKKIIFCFIYYSEIIGLQLKNLSIYKYFFARRIIDCILLPSDIHKIFFRYKSTFGVYPNLVSPKNFNEYLQRSKFLRRKPNYTKMADKLLVRDYVKNTVGEEHLVPLIWYGTDLRNVDIEALPRSFIIKANQGSGKNIIVLNKHDFDWEAAYEKTAKWLFSDHSTYSAEWQYRWIPPFLILEKLLLDGKTIPLDYKFFCFHGHCIFLQIDFGRHSNHKRNIYDRNFNLLDIRYLYPNYYGRVSKPRCYDHMLRVAETIAGKEPFVRVDLYDTGKPVFGEITFHPEAGFGRFEPETFNTELIRLIYKNKDSIHNGWLNKYVSR
nr:ATP-grasp fold amidoligase family protein [uncultured Desulfobacter sp.]